MVAKVSVIPDTRLLDDDISRLRGLLDIAVASNQFSAIAEIAASLVLVQGQRQAVLSAASAPAASVEVVIVHASVNQSRSHSVRQCTSLLGVCR